MELKCVLEVGVLHICTLSGNNRTTLPISPLTYSPSLPTNSKTTANIHDMLAGGGHTFASLLPTFLSRQFEHMILSYSATIRRKDFHFCRLYPGDDFATSLSRHEHYLCLKLKLKPGDNVLVIGCGTGDIVFELINYADVNVIGFDEDADKIQQALQRVQRSNLSNRSVSFVSGTFSAASPYLTLILSFTFFKVILMT